MKRFCTPLFLLCAIFLSAPARANLVVNASFEDPPLANYQLLPGGSSAITGWQTVLSGVERYKPTTYLPPYGISGTAPDGLLILDLNADVSGGGGIEQAIPTDTGQQYVLTFYEGTMTGVGRNGTGSIVASAGSATNTFSVVNASSTIAWTQFSLPFTANSSSTLVSFQNFELPSETFALLDNVSVTVVPEPSSLTLAALGLAAGLLAWRRAPPRRARR